MHALCETLADEGFDVVGVTSGPDGARARWQAGRSTCCSPT